MTILQLKDLLQEGFTVSSFPVCPKSQQTFQTCMHLKFCALDVDPYLLFSKRLNFEGFGHIEDVELLL